MTTKDARIPVPRGEIMELDSLYAVIRDTSKSGAVNSVLHVAIIENAVARIILKHPIKHT